ncbi:MAG: hypothetical protein V4606_02865 [Patescibacteria group bacterium]
MPLASRLVSNRNQVAVGEILIAVEANNYQLSVTTLLVSKIPSIYDFNGPYFFCSLNKHYKFIDYNLPPNNYNQNSLWRFSLPIWRNLQDLQMRGESGYQLYLRALTDCRQGRIPIMSEETEQNPTDKMLSGVDA